MATIDAEFLDGIKVHDVDTHLLEPPDLWTSRMSEKWGDLVPHVKRIDDRDSWYTGDERIGNAVGGQAQAGWKEPYPRSPHRYEDAQPGAWKAEDRLAWMDANGVYSQILYPNTIAFHTGKILAMDPQLRLEVIRTYNDFLTEFCSIAPDRLLPLCNLPWWDIDESVAELKRCHDLGHKGLNFGWQFEKFDLPPLRSDHWEPVLKMTEEMGWPVNFHVAFNDTFLDDRGLAANPGALDTLELAKISSEFFLSNARCISELIMGRICERYPTLKLVSVESGVGYVPFLLDALDWQWNSRNGYRDRRWDTRAGTIELAIPRLREGSYFPDWLLEPRRRAEKALVAVVADCYLRGVSTRRVDKLVQTMGIEGISKSQVSRMAGELDEMVTEFRNRPLDAGPDTYVWADALTQRVREGGRIVNIAVVIATGVNANGHREVLGVDVITAEDGAGWLAFFRSLVARGLDGTALVISDAHEGLVAAIGATLQGASWQRCRTHYLRNLLTKVPKASQPMVATLVRTIFEQPDAASVWAQHGRVVAQLTDQFPVAAEHLADAASDVLAFTGFPKAHWRQIWSNNPQERLNKELRRRTDVVGIFPNRDAVIRLVGAVLAEQHDEWAVIRRYMAADSLARARLHVIDSDPDHLEEVTNDDLSDMN